MHAKDNTMMYVLGALVVGVIVYMMLRNEKFNVQKVRDTPCNCPDCAETVYHKAVTGQMYGCDASNPYVLANPAICNARYRKELLHGCGIAGQ